VLRDIAFARLIDSTAIGSEHRIIRATISHC